VITRSDIITLENAGETLYRLGQNQLAIAVFALCLRELKEMNSNLDAVGLAFLCDIDESAGMAEVVELNTYSRKVPCE
jgi:hypothetical protein